jgi:putative transposase
MRTDLFILRGTPGHVRSDNGPEFAASAVKGWISGVGAKTAFIEPGSPWENGYVESFNGKLRGEMLNMEVFNTLAEAKVLIEGWRRHYNTVRPHSSPRYRPPALLPPLSPASTGGVLPLSPRALRLKPSHSHVPLIIRPDPLVGAGQPGVTQFR